MLSSGDTPFFGSFDPDTQAVIKFAWRRSALTDNDRMALKGRRANHHRNAFADFIAAGKLLESVHAKSLSADWAWKGFFLDDFFGQTRPCASCFNSSL